MSNILINKAILKNGKLATNTLLKEYLRLNQCNVVIRYSSQSPVQALQRKIESKELVSDVHQMNAMKQLDALHKNLSGYSPKFNAGGGSNMIKTFLTGSGHRDDSINTNAPKGVYLYGGVGGGKTTIMDIFFNCCNMIPYKNRVHYTTFMNKVHSRIHEAKIEMGLNQEHDKTPFDPTLSVANKIANESWLLCLDEFQVTDIADAMILKRLFTHIFNNGVVLVATSNRAPDDLYKNGLQRSQFLPFIPILKSRCHIVTVDGGVDYRQLAAKGTSESYFFIKSKGKAKEEIDRLFKILCTQENDTVRSRTITHFGRNITFAKACGQVLDSNFAELCDRPFGGNDYIQVSQYFHTVIIRDVPQLTTILKSQFRRFVTLIDTLYDNRNRVVISCDVSINDLFAISGGSDVSSDANRMLMDDLKIEQGSQDAGANVFTNSEEIFAIDRARSRLNEMQSKQYWQQAGKGR